MPTRISLLVVLFLSFTSLSCFAQTRVAVTPFEADHGLQRYTAYAGGELENLIAGLGNVTLVERARMDQMTKELSFGAFSGLTDPNQVAKFGKMAGASILVTGSLLKVDTERQGFTGFGISTGMSKTTATIRVRAYDVEKGAVIYSSTATGSTSGLRTNFGGVGKADEASAAIEDALKNLAKDENFKGVFAKLDAHRSPTGKIKIEIAPTPGNVDIEINGVYQGSTPATLEFVSGVTVTIKLTKAGYVPWEKTVAPAPGMRMSPELEKRPLPGSAAPVVCDDDVLDDVDFMVGVESGKPGSGRGTSITGGRAGELVNPQAANRLGLVLPQSLREPTASTRAMRPARRPGTPGRAREA